LIATLHKVALHGDKSVEAYYRRGAAVFTELRHSKESCFDGSIPRLKRSESQSRPWLKLALHEMDRECVGIIATAHAAASSIEVIDDGHVDATQEAEHPAHRRDSSALITDIPATAFSDHGQSLNSEPNWY
jgi:hypothetical protein